MTIEKRTKLLLIDDEAGLRCVLRDLLEDGGYQVVEASNGKEGLDVFEKNQDTDIVLLDLKMPKMDGAQFLEVLRSRQKLEGVPVVVISAIATNDIEEFMKEHRLDDYVVKPYEDDDLLERLKKALDKAS